VYPLTCANCPQSTAQRRAPVDGKHDTLLDYTEYGKGGLRGAKPPLGVRTNHLLSFPAQSLTLQFSAFEKLERLSAPFQSITSHTVFFQKYFRFLTTCPRHEPRFFFIGFDRFLFFLHTTKKPSMSECFRSLALWRTQQ